MPFKCIRETKYAYVSEMNVQSTYPGFASSFNGLISSVVSFFLFHFSMQMQNFIRKQKNNCILYPSTIFLFEPGWRMPALAIYRCAAFVPRQLKRLQIIGEIVRLCGRYKICGKKRTRLHSITINQGLLINKVHFFILDDSGDYQKDTVLVILINKPIHVLQWDVAKGDALLWP